MNALPASRGVRRGGRWAVGIAAAVLIGLFWRPIRILAGQLLLSLLIAAAALPLCRRLERRFSPGAAALGAVGALTAGILGLIALLLPPLIGQITLLIDQAPRLLDEARALFARVQRWEGARLLGLSDSGPDAWLVRASQWIGDITPWLMNAVAAGLQGLGRAFLTPLLSYYLLRDRETFSYRLSLLIPLKYRKQALTALKEMRREAGGYARGQTLVALAVGALTSLGLLFVGIPAWLALGLIMGLCEWIPYVGPLIGGVPIVLFALPMGLRTALWAVGITAAVQQFEGFFLSPRLMGGATGLHPAAVVLLLTFGGLAWGLLGMMAAIPLFVCLRGAARVLYGMRQQEN